VAAGSGLAEPLGVIAVGMLLHEPSYCSCVLQTETRPKSIYFLCLMIWYLI